MITQKFQFRQTQTQTKQPLQPITMVSFSQRISLASAFLVLAANAESSTLSLPWCVRGAPYAARQARAGDTVTFDWTQGVHDANYYPSGACSDAADAVLLGIVGGASYTFTDEDVGTDKTFVCSVGNHCDQGQILTFTVLEAAAEFDYDLSTPCNEDAVVTLGNAPVDPAPVEKSDTDALEESSGYMVAGRLATVATVLSVVGAGIIMA